MSREKHIEIVEGDEAQKGLGDRELIQLTNRVNKMERGEAIGQLRHAIALRIHDSLKKEGTKHVRVKHELIGKIDKAFGPITHMKNLRDHSQVAIAKDGDKTVGMIGFEFCGTDPHSGKNVFEIRRIAVQKKYEGRGIGSQLHKTMFERVRSIDPDALILIDTEQPAIMKQCMNMGYKPCAMMEVLRIKFGDDLKKIHEYASYYQTTRTQFFLYDPSAQVTASDTH